MKIKTLAQTLSMIGLFLIGIALPDAFIHITNSPTNLNTNLVKVTRLERHEAIRNFLITHLGIGTWPPKNLETSLGGLYRRLPELVEKIPEIYNQARSLGGDLNAVENLCGKHHEDYLHIQDEILWVIDSLGPIYRKLRPLQGKLPSPALYPDGLKLKTLLIFSDYPERRINLLHQILDSYQTKASLCSESFQNIVIDIQLPALVRTDSASSDRTIIQFESVFYDWTIAASTESEHSGELREMTAAEFFTLYDEYDKQLLHEFIPEINTRGASISSWMPGSSYRLWQVALPCVMFFGLLTAVFLANKTSRNILPTLDDEDDSSGFPSVLLTPLTDQRMKPSTKTRICVIFLSIPVLLLGTVYLIQLYDYFELKSFLTSEWLFSLENAKLRQYALQSVNPGPVPLIVILASGFLIFYLHRLLNRICEQSQ